MKKYNNFLNENEKDYRHEMKKLQDEYEIEYEKSSDLEKLFVPTLQKLIDSDNKIEIQKFIDYCEDNKMWLSNNQFLHGHLYKSDNPNEYSDIGEPKDVDIDYDEIDKYTELYHKQRKILDVVENKISSIMDIILKTDDLQVLYKYIPAIGGVGYESGRFFQKIYKLKEKENKENEN